LYTLLVKAKDYSTLKADVKYLAFNTKTKDFGIVVIAKAMNLHPCILPLNDCMYQNCDDVFL